MAIAPTVLLLVNGLYDLLCAIAIASRSDTLFARLHTGMFTSAEPFQEPATRNLLANWIFLYGLVRIAGGLSHGQGRADHILQILVVCTYVLEIQCLTAMGHDLILWKFWTTALLAFLCSLCVLLLE
jgi:hypothetical protein